MQIALIGFSKSGKTTVFNALTGADAEVSAFAVGKAKTHRAVVQVPDERLDRLCELFQSKKLVHATVDYVDPVGIRRDLAGEGGSLGDEMLNTIGTADALAAVIRAFEDESGVECDPVGDFEAIHLELLLSDLKKVENRLERIRGQIQRVAAVQKKTMQAEADALDRVKTALEAGRPIRALDLDAEEDRILRAFQFLTVKPLLVVVNLAEDRMTEGEKTIGRMRDAVSEDPADAQAWERFLALCGRAEMDIARLEPEERAAFLEEYGIEEPGAARMIRLSYEALGLISFLTVGPTEAHAWTIRRGATAVEAAGEVHSDMERGFIRAQVTPWRDLLDAESFAEAKKRALLRIEGRDYVIQDGDVIEVLFNV
ncbi:redox-regulated ATPase YchF [Candidatus Sumerlaeota bacterium]|nr:redox-regulated ATPase YchF [Candidatus Sumerlaeota bacterium]